MLRIGIIGGFNPQYDIAGLGEGGGVRAMELPDHRFYVETLFHPQLESRPGSPSSLLLAFANAASARTSRATV